MSFVLREPPPPPPPPPEEQKGLPGKLCFFALAVMSCFYYYLIFIVPSPGADESTLAARLVLGLSHRAEAHPILLGLAMLACLIPGLIDEVKGRQYLLSLIVLYIVLFGGCFAVSSHAGDHVASALQGLSTQRQLPETIRGQ